jgi:hypothetical protein
MTIAPHHPLLAMCHGNLLAVLGHKKLWLRVNRVLAWLLVISPVLQIVLRSNLVNGLMLDLAILVVHAALSIWLFGAPKLASAADTAWMRRMGVSYAQLTLRNRFLLSGWRVLLSSGYQVVFALVIATTAMLNKHLVWLSSDIPALIATTLLISSPVFVLFYGFMLPYAIVTHTFGASRYALRRWGVTKSAASGLSTLIVVVFLITSIANLVRPSWS